MDRLRVVARDLGIPLHVQGLPMVFHTSFTDQARIQNCRSYENCDLDLQNRFVAKLLENGVRITGRGTWFLSAAHTPKDIELALEAVRDSLNSLRVGERELSRRGKLL